jgi:hypothetical protein
MVQPIRCLIRGTRLGRQKPEHATRKAARYRYRPRRRWSVVSSQTALADMTTGSAPDARHTRPETSKSRRMRVSPTRAARGAARHQQSRQDASAAARCPGRGETAERSEASGGTPKGSFGAGVRAIIGWVREIAMTARSLAERRADSAPPSEALPSPVESRSLVVWTRFRSPLRKLCGSLVPTGL